MKKPLLNIMSFISRFNIPICLFGLYVFLTRAMEIQNCVIKWIIGYPCPGCGMTRAVFSLIQFDFIQAFRYNPFVYLLPFLFLGIAFQHIDFVKKNHFKQMVGHWYSFLDFNCLYFTFCIYLSCSPYGFL